MWTLRCECCLHRGLPASLEAIRMRGRRPGWKRPVHKGLISPSPTMLHLECPRLDRGLLHYLFLFYNRQTITSPRSGTTVYTNYFDDLRGRLPHFCLFRNARQLTFRHRAADRALQPACTGIPDSRRVTVSIPVRGSSPTCDWSIVAARPRPRPGPPI